MKKLRQGTILDIIRKADVDTQEELAQMLRERYPEMEVSVSRVHKQTAQFF